jgi:nucleoside-diphosphate-sugar epimerase
MKIIVIGNRGAISTALKKYDNYLFLNNLEEIKSNKIFTDAKTVIYSRGYSHASPVHFFNSKKLIISNVIFPLEIFKNLDKFNVNLFIYLSTNKIKYYELYINFFIIKKYIKFFQPYIWSKIQGENYLSSFSKISKCKLLILRLPPIIGTIPKGKLKYIIKYYKFFHFFKFIIPNIKIKFLSISKLNNFFIKLENNNFIDKFDHLNDDIDTISLHVLIDLIFLINKNVNDENKCRINLEILNNDFIKDLIFTIKQKYS